MDCWDKMDHVDKLDSWTVAFADLAILVKTSMIIQQRIKDANPDRVPYMLQLKMGTEKLIQEILAENPEIREHLCKS